MLYVDDGIFAGPDRGKIELLIAGLKEEVNMMDKGDLSEYLGVLVEKLSDGRYKLSQPHLIKQILSNLWFGEETKAKPMLAPGSQVLERDINAELMEVDFHYQ
jgi:hypothetical protein